MRPFYGDNSAMFAKNVLRKHSGYFPDSPVFVGQYTQMLSFSYGGYFSHVRRMSRLFIQCPKLGCILACRTNGLVRLFSAY